MSLPCLAFIALGLLSALPASSAPAFAERDAADAGHGPGQADPPDFSPLGDPADVAGSTREDSCPSDSGYVFASILRHPRAAAVQPRASRAAPTLAANIDRALERSGLRAQSAYSVLEIPATASPMEAGLPVLAAWRERSVVKPASNMKLLTTGAALAILGPEFRFRTSLLLDRRSEGPSPPGTGVRVIVVGDGDPCLGDPGIPASLRLVSSSSPTHGPPVQEDLLDAWVGQVRAQGITAIDELVVDARIFDREVYHPAWPGDGQALRPYCAEVWGLNYHANALHVSAQGDSAGPLRSISLTPDFPDVRVANKATVVAGRSKSTLVVTRPRDSNDLVVAGRLRAGQSERLDLSVHDAPRLFAGLLASRLERAGVRVGHARSALDEDPMPRGDPIAIVETPISVVLARANTDSSNLHAESLLKRMAAEVWLRSHARVDAAPRGSWRSGTEAVRSVLADRIGEAAAAAFMVSDGSGLSHDNRVTAEGLARWTASTAVDPRLGAAFVSSLARAGYSGTVARRFASIKDSPVVVHCKTGYILGVSSLTGIAMGPDGRRIAFSIIGNDLAQGDRVARSRTLQESVVTEIVRSLETPASEGSRRSVPP